MALSTHYYVLSLGAKICSLFEAFRDTLIDVENRGFPVSVNGVTSRPENDEEILELVRNVDRCFANYHMIEPLKLVVVGEKNIQSVFFSVTAHGNEVIGRIESDHTGSTARSLGEIVWPVVKNAMSGVLNQAMCDLEVTAGRGQLVSGIEAVIRLANRGTQTTLLVEDGYHMTGSIGGTDQSPVISPDVDVREANDDAVDAIVDKVLASGGNVIFAPDDSLIDRDRIVLFHKKPIVI